jgi:hypothetical protein
MAGPAQRHYRKTHCDRQGGGSVRSGFVPTTVESCPSNSLAHTELSKKASIRMAEHAYSPEDALALLMRKLTERDERLAEDVQQVIDAGKDIEETEPRIGRRRPRSFRRTVPYRTEEALKVAMLALPAYFYELPLLVEAYAEDFRPAILGSDQGSRLGGDLDKALELELVPETRVLRGGDETHPIPRIAAVKLSEQLANLDRVADLLHFDRGPHDDTG